MLRAYVVTALVAVSPFFTEAALAQTAGNAEVQPTGTAKPEEVSASMTPPKPVGLHGCSGYPPAAVRDSTSGMTKLSFTLTAQGTVANAAVTQSSGSQVLDKAALMCVAAWLYKPATKDGDPVAVPWQASVSWRMDDPTASDSADVVSVPVWSKGGFRCEGWYAAGSQKPARAVILAFTVAADGSVQNVRKLQGSGSDKVDVDAVECLQERHYQPAKQHGKPVEFQLTDSLY
ncbi:MAG TPA: TonB family protein [Rhizomicrobium sp.]